MDRQWFRDRLHALGKTQAELARRLDLDASAVTRLLKGERQLKGAEAARLAGLLECTVDEVLRAAGGPAHAADGFLARPMAVAQPAEMPRNLPVFGAAVGGPDGAFEMNGEIHEFLERPPVLQRVRNAYAVYVTGDSMRPMFQPGWVVHVNPNRPLTPGCGVVVQIRPPAGDTAPLCYIKEYVRHSAGRLVVRQYNPSADIEWPAERVLAIHRIVGIAEM